MAPLMAAEALSIRCLPPHVACSSAKPPCPLPAFRESRCFLARVSSPDIILHQAGCPGRQQRAAGVKSLRVVNQGEDVGVAEEFAIKFDVSSNCVQPVFRSSPWLLKEELLAAKNQTAKILFLSEGNVCRSVYAEAIFNVLLQENGLQDEVQCASKATKNYNKGEPPDARALEIANEKGLQLLGEHVAIVFDHMRDIMEYDLVLVMDKFNATDVLKEISVYDTIDKGGNYTSRVHRLGDFSPPGSAVEDIDDPLYGNMGGPDELDNLRSVYEQVRVSCKGLIEHLLQIRLSLQEGETLKEGLAKSVLQMKDLEWMVPPMLQKR